MSVRIRRSRIARHSQPAEKDDDSGVPRVRYLADSDALETILSIRDRPPTLSREEQLVRKAFRAGLRSRQLLSGAAEVRSDDAAGSASDTSDVSVTSDGPLEQLGSAVLEECAQAGAFSGSALFGFQRYQRHHHLQRLAEEMQVKPPPVPDSPPPDEGPRHSAGSAPATPSAADGRQPAPASPGNAPRCPGGRPSTPGAADGRPPASATPGTVPRRPGGPPSTPKTSASRGSATDSRPPQTPSSRTAPLPAKTPQAVRRRIQQRLSKLKQEDIAVSDDDSDYSPLEEDSDDEKEEEEAVEKPDSESEPEPLEKPGAGGDRARHGAAAEDAVDGAVAAEQYFELHASAGVTSNHTLSRLSAPQLSREALQTLLSSRATDHAEERAALAADAERQVPHWLAALRHGFNVLLHGLGSKRELLERMRERWLRRWLQLVVCGYHPALTWRHMLQTLAEDVLALPAAVSRPEQQLEAALLRYSGAGGERLFLLVHSIDGPQLRGERAQQVLAQLAQAPRVHLIASVDHINAPLIWDQHRLAQFNFLWFDATTLSPYAEETSFEGSLLVRQTGELALCSLRHVFQSLTPNARGVFLLLAKHQVGCAGERRYEGLPLSELYRRCREAFLVSSQVALQAQLTEFRDHRLVRVKQSHDGQQMLTVPLNNSLVAEFLSSCEQAD